MKSEKAITLTSLMIYIIGMIMIISIVSVVTTYFYKNIKNVGAQINPVAEYTKFNNYFTDEINKKNIKICEKQIQIVQFHPSYSYNEFMETIDARGVNKDGVFKKIASDARNDPDKKYVLIIDEINRANVSEILGEKRQKNKKI